MTSRPSMSKSSNSRPSGTALLLGKSTAPSSKGSSVKKEKKDNSEKFYPNGVTNGVYIEELRSFGLKQLESDTPLELDVMLDQKGLLGVYDSFIKAIVQTKNMISIFGDFNLSAITALLQGAEGQAGFGSQFEDKGVKVVVCKCTADWDYRWLEFVDLAVAGENYMTSNDHSLTSLQRELLHPKGVYMENLKGGDRTTLQQKCPIVVQELLARKGLQLVYDKFIQAVVTSKNTVSWIYAYNAAEILAILEEKGFAKQFEKGGVRVVVCHRSPISKWLEFIDLEVAPNYVPKYDAKIFLVDDERYVPDGVVVEEIIKSKELVKKCPKDLKELLERKNLQVEYDEAVKAIAKNGRDFFCDWKTSKISDVLDKYKQCFAAKGVRLVLCKQRATLENKRWLEFIDDDIAKDYTPRFDYNNTNKIGEGLYLPPKGVAVEELGDKDKLITGCPNELKALLDRTGLTVEYDKLVKTIATEESTRNMLGQWYTSAILSVVNEFKTDFELKGVKVVLCKHKWATGTYRWLEFIDTSLAPSGYVPQYDAEARKKVLNGQHKVPVGVEVEELVEGGRAKFENECPPEVQKLLVDKSATQGYETLVSKLAPIIPETLSLKEKAVDAGVSCAASSLNKNLSGKSRKNAEEDVKKSSGSALEYVGLGHRSMEERWAIANTKMQWALEDFNNEFADNGIKAVLCERQSDEGITIHWLEFVDLEAVGDYVPQYDVGNWSDQVIKTESNTILKFPNGVAVEQLQTDGSLSGRADLRELKAKTPEAVKSMLEPKELMEEYVALMNILCESGVGKAAGWSSEKVQDIAKVLSPKFEAKGVALIISHKEERVIDKIDAGPNVGQLDVGRWDKYLWIEFVDRMQQPYYVPQYGIHLNASRVGTIQMDQIMLVGTLVYAGVAAAGSAG